MTRSRTATWLGAALFAVPMPAAAQHVCTSLERIAASAREGVPFAALRQALAADQSVVPGIPARDCRATESGLSCRVRGLPVEEFLAWPDPLPCAGAVPAEASPPSRNDDWRRAWSLSGLRVEYGVTCQVCRGGVVSFLTAYPERSKSER